MMSTCRGGGKSFHPDYISAVGWSGASRRSLIWPQTRHVNSNFDPFSVSLWEATCPLTVWCFSLDAVVGGSNCYMDQILSDQLISHHCTRLSPPYNFWYPKKEKFSFPYDVQVPYSGNLTQTVDLSCFHTPLSHSGFFIFFIVVGKIYHVCVFKTKWLSTGQF